MIVSDVYPRVARICRWVPYAKIHGLRQKQLPKGSYRPQGIYRLTHPTATLPLDVSIPNEDGKPFAPIKKAQIALGFSMRQTLYIISYCC